MPIDFNPQALDMFRNTQLANENSVANLDGKGGLKANGTFHSGNIFRTIVRSGDERRANNEIRTELLRSLEAAAPDATPEERADAGRRLKALETGLADLYADWERLGLDRDALAAEVQN